MDIIEKIISNFKNNKSLYIGEKVTIAEHMIQSAMMAEKSKCKKNFISARQRGLFYVYDDLLCFEKSE